MLKLCDFRFNGSSGSYSADSGTSPDESVVAHADIWNVALTIIASTRNRRSPAACRETKLVIIYISRRDTDRAASLQLLELLFSHKFTNEVDTGFEPDALDFLEFG